MRSRYRRSITCRYGSWWAKNRIDDGVADEGALHAAAFHREVDDPDEQHLARAGGAGSASAAPTAASTLASSASVAARTISSLDLNWW